MQTATVLEWICDYRLNSRTDAATVRARIHGATRDDAARALVGLIRAADRYCTADAARARIVTIRQARIVNVRRPDAPAPRNTRKPPPGALDWLARMLAG